jgi:hypothetical protein
MKGAWSGTGGSPAGPSCPGEGGGRGAAPDNQVMDEHVQAALLSRLRVRGTRMILAASPDAPPDHWLRRRFLLREPGAPSGRGRPGPLGDGLA